MGLYICISRPGLDNPVCLLILPLFLWVCCKECCSIRTRSPLLDQGTPAQSADKSAGGGWGVYNDFFSMMAELWTCLSYGDVELEVLRVNWRKGALEEKEVGGTARHQSTRDRR